MAEQVQFNLKSDEIPTAWYNLSVADRVMVAARDPYRNPISNFPIRFAFRPPPVPDAPPPGAGLPGARGPGATIAAMLDHEEKFLFKEEILHLSNAVAEPGILDNVEDLLTDVITSPRFDSEVFTLERSLQVMLGPRGAGPNSEPQPD